MIRLAVIFLVLLASVGIGIQLNHDPGHVLIALNHWTIETPLWLAVLLLILVFFLLHGLLILLSQILKSPETFKNWREKRRMQKARAKTQQGLLEFTEGHFAEAKYHLIKALPDSDSPLLNYLTAARAAQEMGDNKRRDDYLRQAQESTPHAKFAIELTQAQLQLANKQWEQAHATLKHLQSLSPKHPYVLKLLLDLYKEVKDWPQLILLLPEVKKHQVVVGKAFDDLCKQVYLAALKEQVKTAPSSDVVSKWIETLPKSLHDSPELMAIYSEFLLKNNEASKAEGILRQGLKKAFNETLIGLYGQLNLGDKPLVFAESFIKKHPHSAKLFLSLGRLSAANHLWGKAKLYLEKSIELGASPEAYAELGKLFENLGERHNACEAYRQGLFKNLV